MAYKTLLTSILQISFFFEFLYTVKLPELKNRLNILLKEYWMYRKAPH